MQMGDHIGEMIGADLKGAKRPAFRYFDKGDMATIGRMSAVADVKWPFKAHLGGWLAWVTWLVVHIFFLIGFRNRVAVLFSWVWSYFSFTRSARLITGDQRLPGWQEQVDAGPHGPRRLRRRNPEPGESARPIEAVFVIWLTKRWVKIREKSTTEGTKFRKRLRQG